MAESGLMVRLMDAMKKYSNLEITVNGHRFYGTPVEYDRSGVTFEVAAGPHRGERPTIPYKYLENIRLAPAVRMDTLSENRTTHQLAPVRRAA
jgi:hypothetical protein